MPGKTDNILKDFVLFMEKSINIYLYSKKIFGQSSCDWIIHFYTKVKLELNYNQNAIIIYTKY